MPSGDSVRVAGNWKDRMNEDLFVLDTIAVQIRLEDVLAQLGYPPGARLSSSLHEKIRVQMIETLQLVKPKGAYLRLERDRPEGFELFSKAEGIVLALVTIGGAVECRAAR